jgi:predicted MFS family arabinose efflux permease
MNQIFGTSTLFAVALLAFSTIHVLWFALIVLFIYGRAMSSSNIAALAYVQLNTPRNRLGRVFSLYTIVFRVGPAIGAFLFGALAERTNLDTAGLAFGAVGLAITLAIAAAVLRSMRPV